MSFTQLITILPCRDLESWDLNLPDELACEILAAWTAPWHPALIAQSGSLPSQIPAESPPEDLKNAVIVIPPAAEPLFIDPGWEKIVGPGNIVVRGLADRKKIVAALLAQLPDRPGVAEELVFDFFALGYCHFVVEILTRQLRHMSNLDPEGLRIAVVAAARAAVEGKEEEARKNLTDAFEKLHEAKEYFYPLEPALVDLTLIARTTLGESLRRQFEMPGAKNFLLSGETLEAIAENETGTLPILLESIKNQTATLLGGEYSEMPLPLVSHDAIRADIEHGLQTFEKILGVRPVIYARRRFGLTPVLPALLKKFGFSGVFHCTLDDGQFPTGTDSRLRWEGIEGGAIDALTTIPLDGRRDSTFLRLPQLLSRSMEVDYGEPVIFAHWPGTAAPWYDDIRRTNRYTRTLGALVDIRHFLDNTEREPTRRYFQADAYRAPYLVQDVGAGEDDPLSRWVRYYRRYGILDSVQTLQVFSSLLQGGEKNGQKTTAAETAARYARRWREWRRAVDADCDKNASKDAELDARLQKELDGQLKYFADSLGDVTSDSASGVAKNKGILLFNGNNYRDRQVVVLSDTEAVVEMNEAVKAVEENAAVVDVPSLGFAWVGQAIGGDNDKNRGGKSYPRAVSHHSTDTASAEETYRLSNEFFQIRFDPATGALQSVMDYKNRHARVAQQLAFRQPVSSQEDPADDSHYSIMAADAIEAVEIDPFGSEMQVRGRMLDKDGNVVSGFIQKTRVQRGSRVIELDIELQPERLPEREPWQSYYACRFAWSDPVWGMSRSVNGLNVGTDARKIVSPLFIDVHDESRHTTFFAGGLPYHRRISPRKLDTLLLVAGETARRFRLGIGIDIPHPTAAAMRFLAPRLTVDGCHRPPTSHGWLFHLDRRNIMVSWWAPVYEQGDQRSEVGDQGRGARDEGRGARGEGRGIGDKGPAVGFRVRLTETEGRPAPLAMRCFRPVASAVKLENRSESPNELPVTGDCIAISLGPYESWDMEVRFL